MFDKSKLDTVCGKAIAVVSECKLLFAKVPFKLLSTEVYCDDILANIPYRLIESENIALFDSSLLPRLMVSERAAPVLSVIAYGRDMEGYRFITNGEPTLTAYAAVALSLYYGARLCAGECVKIISERGALFATVTDDGVLLYD